MDFTGTGVALVTPFMPDFSIDETSLRRLVDHVIAGGIDFLVALGTTSEAATLSPLEKSRVAEIILDQNKGRIPVMVGIGGNCTGDVTDAIKNFSQLEKCQGILSVVPYYNKPTQEGLYRHFKEVAAHSPVPVFLYNVPGRTAINLHSQTVIRLSLDCPGIVGIKEAGCEFHQISETLRGMREDFIMLSGDDCYTLPMLGVGSHGVIAVIANLFPRAFSDMVRYAKAGDFVAARKIHLTLTEMFRLLFKEGNPAGIKAALHCAGIIDHNTLRLPLVESSEELYREIAEEMESIDITS